MNSKRDGSRSVTRSTPTRYRRRSQTCPRTSDRRIFRRPTRIDRDAIRQIRLHESVGHLTSDEADKRVEIIYTCRTRGSIAAVLAGLPDVGQREVPRRITQRDRDEALKQIDEALLDGRITSDEHAVASAQVNQARTRQELKAAFGGLTNPTVAAARRKAVDAGRTAAEVSGRAVGEGGRRVSMALARFIVAVVVAIAGIVALILGTLPGRRHPSGCFRCDLGKFRRRVVRIAATLTLSSPEIPVLGDRLQLKGHFASKCRVDLRQLMQQSHLRDVLPARRR